MSTFFYEFSQNNTGGSFDVDDKVCHRLFVEAKSAKEARKKAKDLGVYFNGVSKGLDCGCCGDRWYKVDDSDKIDLTSISKSYKKEFLHIKDYAQYLANKYGWTTPDSRIFYIDGTVENISKKELI